MVAKKERKAERPNSPTEASLGKRDLTYIGAT
jgi:hypothetical protein